MVVNCARWALLILATLLCQSRMSIAETVRFATMDFAPYALGNGEGKSRGLFMDINAAIANRAQFQFSDRTAPIARMVKNLEHGISDCAVFLLSPWSKANFVPVAEVLDRFESVVITRKGIAIRRLEDLHGKLLAIPRGSYTSFPIATNPNIRRHETNNYAQSVKLLKAGRVDAIAGTLFSVYHYLSEFKMARTDIGGVLHFDSRSLWLHCSKTTVSDAVLNRLRDATVALRTEGAFAAIRDRYVPAEFR